MKRIDALIHASQWEEARAVLETLAVPVTLREVKTFGRTPPRREVYRGSAYYSNITAELELTTIVEDARLEATVTALEPLMRGGELVVSAVEGQVHRRIVPQAVNVPRTAPTRAVIGLHAALPPHA